MASYTLLLVHMNIWTGSRIRSDIRWQSVGIVGKLQLLHLWPKPISSLAHFFFSCTHTYYNLESKGAPLSLGWRYNPKESFSPIQPANDEKGSEISSSLRIGGINVINNNNNRIRRSRSELKLSDRERHRRLSANPNVSMEDLHSVLQQVAQVKLGRKESLNEVREQMAKERKARYDALLEERALMLRRRMGIVDGGGGVSKSIWIQER